MYVTDYVIYPYMITIIQIKAARVMLGLKQSDLAAEAGISIATLNNVERGVQTEPRSRTMRAIQQALEVRGITFINDRETGMGVYLKIREVSHRQPTILIVDDSRADRLLYKAWLNKIPGSQYSIIEAESAAAGVEAYLEHQPDCIILDFMMYGADGFQLLAELRRKEQVLPPIIFVTGMHSDITEHSAKSHQVFAYMNKNTMSRDELCSAVKQALAHGKHPVSEKDKEHDQLVSS